MNTPQIPDWLWPHLVDVPPLPLPMLVQYLKDRAASYAGETPPTWIQQGLEWCAMQTENSPPAVFLHTGKTVDMGTLDGGPPEGIPVIASVEAAQMIKVRELLGLSLDAPAARVFHEINTLCSIRGELRGVELWLQAWARGEPRAPEQKTVDARCYELTNERFTERHDPDTSGYSANTMLAALFHHYGVLNAAVCAKGFADLDVEYVKVLLHRWANMESVPDTETKTWPAAMSTCLEAEDKHAAENLSMLTIVRAILQSNILCNREVKTLEKQRRRLRSALTRVLNTPEGLEMVLRSTNGTPESVILAVLDHVERNS